MENLVRVRVADATEQMRIGERTLQGVIAASERLRKRRNIGLHHLEPTGIVLRKRCLPLDDIQRCLPLGTSFSEDQASVLEVECQQADFAGDRGARRLPSKAPRDHQVEYKKQLLVGFNDHPFAQPPQADHQAPFNSGQRRSDGTQQKRVGEPYALNTLPDDARFERTKIQKNVWQFGHRFLLPYARTWFAAFFSFSQACSS